jgi:crotonobetainyl-CoA:carnitine CoA-transferase CaiB-like acyl-CoA transferase
MSGPLSGVTVLEICSAIAGPFATKQLGELGADIIKIERVDSIKRLPQLPHDEIHDSEEFSWRWLNYNTSKSSVALDLQSDEGKDVFSDLVEEADVLIENMRRGSMERLGFGWERLSELNPELVYCSIKGFGDGPYDDWPALDTTIQGISSFAWHVGDLPRPETTRIVLLDMVTALYAGMSIASALFERGASGEGQHIQLSMLDVAVSLLGHQLAEYTSGQHSEDYEPTYGPIYAPNGYFETADGYLALMVPTPTWEPFCELVEKPEWTDESHRYGTDRKRIANREELREDIETILTRHTSMEWMERIDDVEGRVTAAPVNDVESLVEDPQIRSQESIVTRNHPVLGEYLSPNVVPKFSRTPGEIRSDAPGVGEDTDVVLSALGYTREKLERLHQKGIVGGGEGGPLFD